MAEELGRLRKKRSAQTIQKKERLIKETEDKIMDRMPDEEIDGFVEDITTNEVSMAERTNEVEEFLAGLAQKKQGEHSNERKNIESPVVTDRKKMTVSLPKIIIKKFHGEPTAWQGFFDTFQATIGSNSALSDIEKFTYLRGYLGGEAERCIEGLVLTSANYNSALDILKERYGNKQLIVASHMNRILKLERVTSCKSIKPLRCLYDEIESHVRSLFSVGVRSQEYGPLLIPIIVEKLPDEIKLEISRRLGQNNWAVEDFMQILKEEIVARESCMFVKSLEKDATPKDTRSPLSKYEKGEIDRPVSTGVLYAGAGSRRSLVCAFCQGSHFHDKCTIVTDLQKRREIVVRKRLCFKCLVGGHVIRKCRNRNGCFQCKSSNHHSAICDKFNGDEKSENPVDKVEKSGVYLAATKGCVLLQTAKGQISDNEEKSSTNVNILMDLGSQKSYITRRVVSKLKLEQIGEQVMAVNTFGNQEAKPTLLKEFAFCIHNKSRGCHIYMKGFEVPFICSPLQNQRFDIAIKMYPLLKDMDLSYSQGGEIDLLIGADFYWGIVGDEVRRVNECGLTAINSKLGWLLSGPCGTTPSDSTSVMCVQLKTEEEQLSEQVEKFWGLDVLGVQEKEPSVYEQFLDTIEFKNSRYEVHLPFKNDMPVIEDNYALCVKRLHTLWKKLEKDKYLMGKYDEVIREQLRAGVIEKADTDFAVGEGTYMPHRAVVRDDKRTTKVRVVMNASFKNKGPSLNQCMYKGPSLNPLLFDVLLRFRVHNIGLCADIEKAYLQISVWPQHRDYLRFVWFAGPLDGNMDIVRYRFTRVMFGATCSQFLLNGTTKVHADKYKKIDPEFAETVRRHFFVDDFNCGVKNYENGIALYKKVKTRFLEGNFNVQKWRTNDKNLREYIEIQENVGRDGKSSATCFGDKVLGIPWNEQTDSLILDMKDFFKEVDDTRTTKRNVLRVMAGIYDPLGFLEPYTIRIKLFFQGLWSKGCDWDDLLDDVDQKQWCDIIGEMKAANKVFIPRCYCKDDDANPIRRVEIHGFSDASDKAYGACVYLRFICGEGPMVVLVASKSRLAPLKNKQTIPRLELLGNLLLTNLVLSVTEALETEMDISSIHYWTDSLVALAWIKAYNKDFKTFVNNRVSEIRKKAGSDGWNYCPTEINIADVLTRRNKFDMNLWLNGPKFLWETDDVLPSYLPNGHTTQPPGFDDEVALKVNDASLVVITTQNVSVGNIIDVHRYSNLLRLLRITAFVIRFIDNCKRKAKKLQGQLTTYLVSDEISKAKLLWLKDNQIILRRDTKYEQFVKQLNLREDNETLLVRSFSRLIHANIPLDMKAPIMLSKKHKLAELFVHYYHEKVMHRGVKQTLNELRTSYWVTKGRSFVKKILNPCVVCRRLNARPYAYPEHSDLPSFRFDDSRAFSSIGIDYMGPVFCLAIYGGSVDMYKAYVVLYTCASTRAVILDVVHDASANAFLQSLNLFIARRGCPSFIVTDNGSVFRAESTQKFAAARLIRWKFNIEGAPWMGGLFERLVSCVKRCLKKVVGIKRINYIELQTLTCMIELILNNRPICPDYDDDQEEVLTPNHLLYGRRLRTSNDIDSRAVDSDEIASLPKRKRMIETMLTNFWNKWRKEYVTNLREHQRYRFKGRSRSIQINDIVVVFDEKCPRHLWRTGKVEKLLVGGDGCVRGAEVKLSKSGYMIKRPVNKLYPLLTESDCHVESNSTVSDHEAENEVNESDVTPPTDTEDAVESNSSVLSHEAENLGRRRYRRVAAVVGEMRRKQIIQ